MMRMIGAAVGVIGVLLASPASAQWVVVAPKVAESIVEIASKMGSCTGFVIDNERDLVLTAAHCDGPELYADLAPAKVRAKDVKNDLMVLHVEGIDRPALKLAKAPVKIGEEVASYGYGYAFEEALFRVAHISAVDVNIDRASYFVIDAAFVPGQSGGPVVNTKGEVVMIVQLGTEIVGLGVGTDLIIEKVGKYFAGGVKE